MIQTIVVYTFIMFSMMFLLQKRVRLNVTLSKQFFQPNDVSLVLGLLIFSVIFGMRYGVGVDHLNYMQRYTLFQDGNEWMFRVSSNELVFRFISEFLANLGCHYWIYFSVLAFIQVLFLFYAFKRNRPEILPLLAFVFIAHGDALSFMNGIRQQIAVAIFVFSIEFISQKKWLKHYLLLLLAMGFHISAIILFPIYPMMILWYRKTGMIFKRPNWQLLLLGLALILLIVNYQKQIFEILLEIANVLGYEQYGRVLSDKQYLLFSLERARGIGFYLGILFNVILIVHSKRLKQYFDSRYFNIIYDLYFLGVIYGYLSNGSILLGRPNYYFAIFTVVVAAYSLYYHYIHRYRLKNLLFFIFLMSILLLYLTAIIYRMDSNSYRFIFFWQEHLFPLKEDFYDVLTP